MRSRNRLKGSEVRSYALGLFVAGVMSLFADVSILIGIAIALVCISFCMDE